jgi:hypothetical protein
MRKKPSKKELIAAEQKKIDKLLKRCGYVKNNPDRGVDISITPNLAAMIRASRELHRRTKDDYG